MTSAEPPSRWSPRPVSVMLSLFAGLLLLAAPARAQPPSPPRRVALLIGVGAAREGVEALAALLVRLETARRDDVVVLLDRDAGAVEAALDALEQRVREARSAGETTALLLWYSGPARDGALRLGGTSRSREALDALLRRSTAETRVVILDTRDERPPSAAEADRGLLTPALDANDGHDLIVLTADAREEPPRGASLSFRFANGLLGSADTSGDGRVSVAEALGFVASQPQGTASGPGREVLGGRSGPGDLVLADVGARGEGLRLSAGAPDGTYAIFDARGAIAAEMTKAGGERLLALPPGEYLVTLRQGERIRRRPVTVAAGHLTVLGEEGDRRPRAAGAPDRAPPRARADARHWSLAAVGGYQLALDRPTEDGGLLPSAPALGGEVTLHNLITRGLGLGVDASYAWTSGVVRTALLPATGFEFSTVRIGASLLSEWLTEGRWVPFASAHVGLHLLSRSFADASLPRQSYTALTPGVAAGLKLRITPSLGVVGRARMHVVILDVDGPRAVALAEAGLLLTWEFQR